MIQPGKTDMGGNWEEKSLQRFGQGAKGRVCQGERLRGIDRVPWLLLSALMTENLGGAYTLSRLSNGVSLTTVGLSLENNVCCHCIFVALSDSVFVSLGLLVIGWNCKLPFQGIGLMACSCYIHASLYGGVNASCQRGMPLPPGRSWSALIADNGCRWFP